MRYPTLVRIACLASFLVHGSARAATGTDVCHVAGGGSYVLVTVPTQGAEAHLAHGDVLPSTFYADDDGDGHGAPEVSTSACSAPEGYVADATDCDDNNPDVHVGQPELCNGIDDDCSGLADDGALGTPWYADDDGDSYGDPTDVVEACDPPAGYVFDGTDCDDTDSAVNPAASETCSAGDDDCDGEVDEPDAEGAATFYADGDGDGFGDAASTTLACEVPAGYVANDSDCDDGDGTINPGEDEFCDLVDNDCDSVIDEDDAVDATTWYVDVDQDLWGDPDESTRSCAAPDGTVDVAGDCNDGDDAINPDADEVCAGGDEDCDGLANEPDAIDAPKRYWDQDSDGYGDPDQWVISCWPLYAFVDNADDCRPWDPYEFQCGCVDTDGDGLCNSSDGDDDNDAFTDDEEQSGGCDPLDPCSYPDAIQIFCDHEPGPMCGQYDAANDADGDLWIPPFDCDDSDPTINPSAVEVCEDGIDQTCDDIDDVCP